MQEADAERRIQILRGLPVVDAPQRSPPPAPKEGKDIRDDGARRDKKRRRIAGEDDTERDIRFALEDSTTASSRQEMSLKPSKGTEVSLTDKNGHINLFPTQPSKRHKSKNVEAEADATRKKREFEDQYTMRFSNAAGFKTAIGEKPWYQSMEGPRADQEANEAGGTTEPISKDVWGNEDPRRKEREKARLAADDPLAMIQKGVLGLREVERERKKWKAEKERETRDLIREEKRRSRIGKRRHADDDDNDDLENFSLEPPASSGRRKPSSSSTHESHRHQSRRNHHHRHERDQHDHNSLPNGPRRHRPRIPESGSSRDPRIR